jgi:ferredoxin--NADP+ reductase
MTYFYEKPEVTWQEGTNVHVAFEDYEAYEAKKFVRHFSISALPNEDYLTFTTRLSSSPFKQRMQQQVIGDTLMFYSFKQRMPLRYENRPIKLISMGVGLAAFQTMIKAYKNKPGITSMSSIHISKENLFNKELQNYDVDHTWLSPRTSFFTLLKNTYNVNSIYYIAGSDQFLNDVIKLLLLKGHNIKDIEIDKKDDKKDDKKAWFLNSGK